MIVDRWWCPMHGLRTTYRLVAGRRVCDAEAGACGSLVYPPDAPDKAVRLDRVGWREDDAP